MGQARGAGKGSAGSLRLFAACVGISMLLAACGHEDINGRFPSEFGSVEGFVVDNGTNPPTAVVNATVYTFPGGGLARTDSAGFFRMPKVLAGFYEVHATRGPGQEVTVQGRVEVGKTLRVTLTFNPVFRDIDRELIFLTDNGPGGQIATANARGTFPSSDLRVILVSGLGGSYKSLRMSRVSTNEAVVLSNFEHPENPLVFDAYLVAINGSVATATRVTSSAVLKDSVDLSPNGSQIVLSQDTDSDGLFELWILDRTGSNPRRLLDDQDPATGQTFDNRGVSWTADGSTIVFAARRADAASPFDQSDFEVSFMGVIGGDVFDVTFDIDNDGRPTVATRDSSIFYEKTTGSLKQIFLAPLASRGQEVQLTGLSTDQTSPAISNDRQTLVWVSRDNLDGSNADGSPEITVGDLRGPSLFNRRHLTRTPAGLNFNYDSIQWRIR